MSDLAKTIRALAKTSGDSTLVLIGEVVSVDVTARTCEVAPLNGEAALLDVRLQSKQSGDKGCVLVPVEGSIVVVLMVNANAGFVVLAEELTEVESAIEQQQIKFDKDGLSLELEAMELVVGQQQMSISDNGLMVKSSSANLATCVDTLVGSVDKLIDAIMGIQVVDPIYGLLPINPPLVAPLLQQKADLILLKEQFKTFLKTP